MTELQNLQHKGAKELLDLPPLNSAIKTNKILYWKSLCWLSFQSRVDMYKSTNGDLILDLRKTGRLMNKFYDAGTTYVFLVIVINRKYHRYIRPRGIIKIVS